MGSGTSSSPWTTRAGTSTLASRAVMSSLSIQERPWKSTARAGTVVAQRAIQWSTSGLFRASVVSPKQKGATHSAKSLGTVPSTSSSSNRPW